MLSLFRDGDDLFRPALMNKMDAALAADAGKGIAK